jgi:phosphohistidine phosphatase
MRRLMLLRHAKTESDAPSGRDQDRRLDERGRIDAADIGNFVARHPPSPDLVLVSSAVRAQQTWELAWEAMQSQVAQPQVESVPDLYCAEIAQLLHSIRSAAGTDANQMMLIGHNPSMHELALALTGDGDPAARQELARNLPTSGLAIFEFDIAAWDEVSFGRGRLLTFVTPKLLKHGPGD